ncbi:MAG: UvrD-helicase domain-containing protein [Alphaproteobacteria bacterium]|nr:UvrD-helicase domain-containing protein [Alphaproteobacteria bacterium]
MTELPPLPEHLGPLNPAQADAVRHRDGPLLILAGAGSGKTRVLTRRIAYLLETGIPPEQVFAVTFTNKAAAEMKERIEELVGPEARKLWVSTFHSACCRILRAEAEALGYTRRFAIYDDDDQVRIVRQLVADAGYDPKVVVPSAVISRIDWFKNRRIDLEAALEQRRLRRGEPLARVWEDYETQLRASDALDFNDLIGKVVELFEGHPEVLQRYRDTFRYVLVDEYQDTNRTQYTLLQLLAAEHRNLAVVGDDDQSIYGFRGADLRNILDFERDFRDARVVRLEQNYRCSERILEVANAVIAANDGRIAKRLFTETKRGGSRVTLLAHEDPRSEARFVADACLRLVDQGARWSDIAIIYRTNATSQPFEAALGELGVPHKVVGGRPFYARREVRDALAYVRLVTNPADDAAFLRVVNVPARGVGAATLSSLRDAARERGEPLMKAARAVAAGTSRAARAVAGFLRLIDELVEVAAAASLPAFVREVLERSGYVELLRAEGEHEGKGRLENLEQLLRDAATFVPDPSAPDGPAEVLAQWLDRVALAGSEEEAGEGGSVALMTVHNAKGLEFPIVFVVNMVDGQFPHVRSAEDPDGFQEERRLAYVAFTRAQDRLFVSRCRHRFSWDPRGGGAIKEPVARSPFLDQVPVGSCDGALVDAREGPATAEPRRRAGPLPEGRRAELRALLDGDERPRRSLRPSRRADPVPEAPPAMPAGTYRTTTIEHADQLGVGVKVLHDRLGIGTILKIRLPTLVISFSSGSRSVPSHDPGLQILKE